MMQGAPPHRLAEWQNVRYESSPTFHSQILENLNLLEVTAPLIFIFEHIPVDLQNPEERN